MRLPTMLPLMKYTVVQQARLQQLALMSHDQITMYGTRALEVSGAHNCRLQNALCSVRDFAAGRCKGSMTDSYL